MKYCIFWYALYIVEGCWLREGIVNYKGQGALGRERGRVVDMLKKKQLI